MNEDYFDSEDGQGYIKNHVPMRRLGHTARTGRAFAVAGQ